MNKKIKVIIEFNLEEYGCFDDPNNIEYKGNKLSLKTMNKILAIIAYKYAYNDNYEQTPIMASFFEVKDLNNYLEFLESKDVIKRNKHYVKGKTPRKYYFNDYFKNRCKIIDIYYNIGGMVDKNGKMDNRDNRLYRDLLDLEMVDNYRIDRRYDYINGVEVCKFKSYLKNHIEMFNMKNNRTYKWEHERVYTPFVFLNKEVRLNNFSFSDDKLFSLDIPSSFPLFLSIWCIKKGIDKNDYDFIEWCSYIKEGRDKYGKSMIYKRLRELFDANRNSDGVEKYNKTLNVMTKIDKPHIYYEKAKIYFQRWLNGDNKKNIFINNVFKQYFPSIDNLVRGRIMYYELEKLEKYFIFDIVVNKLYKEIDGIKIITCHDQIYIQDKYKESAQSIWNYELNKLYDMLPDKPKIENLIYDDIEELDF